METEKPKRDSDRFSEFEGVRLDSISLLLDEPALLQGPSLSSLLKLNFNKYKRTEVTKDKELLSPSLWNLPEVFRQKLTAFSDRYQSDVNKQNNLADVLRYNFSNGMQLSSQEILRHPLHKKVASELLPQAKVSVMVFGKWPLLQKNDITFISKSVAEIEEIIQSLIASVMVAHRRGDVEIYLQTKNDAVHAMKIQSVEFDLAQELDWHVEFHEKEELEVEFKLFSFRKQTVHFYQSFAVEANEGIIMVHAWRHEFSLLQEMLHKLSRDLFLPQNQMPQMNLTGEIAAKSLLKYLRTRQIPVKIIGGSQNLESRQSQTEIRLDDNGAFFINHVARVSGQKNLTRRGWTSISTLYLQTLSQGLPFLLQSEARDMASRLRTKRVWDMKLFKHLGVVQYIFLEALSLHFDGGLTNGAQVKKEDFFLSLHKKIQSLLIAGSGAAFVRDIPLTELCSKSVLACYEDFTNSIFKSVGSDEAFYSEQGELVLQGVVEREFRLIYELLKKTALTSGGEAFIKSRTPFISRICSDNSDKDLQLIHSKFHFPTGGGRSAPSLHESLDSLHFLIPYGFKIFFRDQALQELADDEFHMDFVLQSESDQKFFNWFELNPKFFLRGQEVRADQLLGLGAGGVVEYDGKLYLVPKKQLPSLRRLENFWQKLQSGKTEFTKRKNGDKVYKLPRSQTLELLALRASGVSIRGDHEWKKLCEFYDNLGRSSRELKLPKSIKATLKPYQISGIQWLQDLYHLKLGALLADDMGLGKTLQTLSFLDDLREKNEMGQVLIVVPSSLIFNWQDEVEKFTPLLKITIFSNRDLEAISKKLAVKEELVVITTYGLLVEHEAYFTQYKWNILIFDEAQNLKNLNTRRTNAARALNAAFKICLTGTPMENHYGEFFSLVDLLVPGSLGELKEFRRQFVNTEMISMDQIEDLKLKIKPLLLRRTKREILEQLPEKQETKVSIAFEERQKEIYRDIALSYNARVKETMETQGPARVQLQMLTALLRLRQACSDPAALPNVRYDKVPPKLETLVESLKEIVESGESALVFTQFIQTLEHAAKILQQNNIPVFVMHGKVPSKQRQKILSEFSKMSAGAVLIMTLKTGGVGLNLTKASYVFHLEPWWNPSVENQATDRAHRLGQNKAVQVFKYIMHESLEEKIEILKERKDKKFKSLFITSEKHDEIGKGSGALSKADFDLLLGIK